jgi:hypothetical protein
VRQISIRKTDIMHNERKKGQSQRRFQAFSNKPNNPGRASCLAAWRRPTSTGAIGCRLSRDFAVTFIMERTSTQSCGSVKLSCMIYRAAALADIDLLILPRKFFYLKKSKFGHIVKGMIL